MDLTTQGLIDHLGYSPEFQSAFLQPFLGGILLDSTLSAPSPMSSYFLERFFIGGAALVPGGIQQFANVLSEGLKINRETHVTTITEDEISTGNGQSFAAKVIIDTRPNQVEGIHWLSTECHYFLSSRPLDWHHQIHLCDTSLPTAINHVANLTEVEPTYSPSGTALLSVTLRPGLSASTQQVQKEVIGLMELPESQVSYVGTAVVPQALPKAHKLPEGFPEPAIPEIRGKRILASDALSYGSQHAAMRMGQRAAMEAIRA
jgi:hypothetical protein